MFGRVVAGQDVANKIARVPRGGGDRPNQDQILEKIEVFRSETPPAG